MAVLWILISGFGVGACSEEPVLGTQGCETGSDETSLLQVYKSYHKRYSERLPPLTTYNPEAKIINVGLPETGAAAFHTFAKKLGLHSLYMGYQSSDQQMLEATLNGMVLSGAVNINHVTIRQSPSLQAFIAPYQVIANGLFMAPGIIEESALEGPGHFVYIATNRSRSAWIKRMTTYWARGGNLLRLMYGLPSLTDQWVLTPEQWGKAYDSHQELLLKFEVPTYH